MRIERDPDLQKLVSLQGDGIVAKDILKELQKHTRRRLTTQLAKQFTLGCSDCKLHAVLDGVSALEELRWERNPAGYELIETFYMGPVYLDSAQEYQNQQATSIINDFSKLSKAEKDKLKTDGCQLSSLPYSFYPPIYNSIKSEIEKESAKLAPGESIAVTVSDLTRDKIRIYISEMPTQGDVKAYNIKYVANGISSSYRVNDYPAKKIAHESERDKNNDDESYAFYESVNFELSPSKARLEKKLNEHVEISLKNATLSEVLKLLNEKYTISFVCDTARKNDFRASVRLEEMALSRALDRLTRIFPDTEWEWRRQGLLIVRGSLNLARLRRSAELQKSTPVLGTLLRR